MAKLPSDAFESSDALDLRQDVAVALSWKCMAQAEAGLADEALASCQRLEGLAHSLADSGDEPAEAALIDWLKWRAEGASALGLAVRGDHRAAMDSFREAYTAFDAGEEGTTSEMLRLVSGLVAVGAPPQDLLAALATDTGKSAILRPLIVALRTLAGNPVRAPREIEEVAADIGRQFDEATEQMRATTSN